MAGRGNFNNGSDQSSPYWNSKSEPEIDVWDPSSVAGISYNDHGVPQPNYTAANSNTISQSAYLPTENYQQSSSSNSYNCGDMSSSNWQNNVIENAGMPQQGAPPMYSHPNSTYSSSPTSNYVPNYPNSGQYFYNDASQPVSNYAVQSNYQPQHSHTPVSNNSGQSFHNNDWPEDSWRCRSNTPSDRVSNYSEPTENFIKVKPFKNPLTSGDDRAADDAAELVKQMHIQGQKARQQVGSTPKFLSKASMSLLANDLKQAAVAFESPENLELARNVQLGIVDVGQKVIVSTLSADAAVFVPRVPQAITEYVPQQASQQQEDLLIENLGLFIDNVLKQPGDFDTLVSLLLQQIKFYLHSDETVKKIVELIFIKAIEEDNFKYLGAKLCDELTMPNVLAKFRSTLLGHFQTEFKTIRDLIEKKTGENDKKIHGFSMFMAEIFIHIKINGNPLKALGRSLSKTLENLVSDLRPTNIAFVCKVLKLAGAKLIDAFLGNENDMENFRKIFENLQKFHDEKKDLTDEENKRLVLLILSVNRLKDSNWGRTMSNTRKKSSIDDPEQYGDELSEVDHNYYMNEPVFFTPEGVQYTAAEAQIPDFYKQHLAKLDLSHLPSEDGSLPWSHGEHQGFDDFVPSDDESELYRQDSFGSEYNADFEQFLAESGQLE